MRPGILLLLFLVMPAPAARATDIVTGLVGHWKLDETSGTTARDTSGKGHPGTLYNIASPATATSGWTSSGRFNGALAFDGSNDYVLVSGLTWTPVAFSVAWWIYPLTSVNYNQGMMASVGWGAWDAHTSTAGAMYVGTDGTTRFSPSELPAGTMELNKWQFFTYTYNGSQGRFYKDGALVAGPKTQNQSVAWGGFSMGIGIANNTINGSIDDVRIYNRALTQTDITALYNNGGPTTIRNARIGRAVIR